MDRELLAYFSDVLEGLLRDVVPVMRTLHPSLEENGNHQGPMDDVDLTTKRYEQQWIIQIQQRTRRQVAEIEEALKRIRSGRFGVCEGCGRDIEVERLKVQPTTTLCVGCKKELEVLQRAKVA
jgi:DnaK suppressor protein